MLPSGTSWARSCEVLRGVEYVDAAECVTDGDSAAVDCESCHGCVQGDRCQLLGAASVPDTRCAVVGAGDNAGAVERKDCAPHESPVAGKYTDLASAGGIPDACRAVLGGGDDAGAVWRK